MNRSTFTLPLTLTALAVAAALGATPVKAAGDAHAARALNITDSAHLRFVRENANSTLIEEGRASGDLPGTVKVLFSVGASVKASFTIYTRAGDLIGSGSGLLHSSGAYASFGGTLSVTHGTGRYSGAHGHGGFYGVINRNTNAITVQTTGTLAY